MGKRHNYNNENNKKGANETTVLIAQGQESTKEPAKGGINVNNLIIKTILVGLFVASFYIRGIIPLNAATQGGIIGFAMDDAVYHMRLVENTLAHFPTRIFYDAYTQYPYGQHLHWGAIFDQAIALLALIAGAIINHGAPTEQTVNWVGAFFPAVLGALVVFPVYVIGKELKDVKTGLIAAFLIAIMPGQFLERSVFGFTDNHVAEALLITMTMAFLVLTVKRGQGILIESWIKRDWQKIKAPAIYSTLAGISLGMYLLTWTAGIFFVVVISAFVILQGVLDYIKKRSSDYLCAASAITFGVALIMILPYVQIENGFDSAYYSLLHVSVLLIGIIAAAGMMWYSRISRKVNRHPLYFVLYLIAAFGIGLVLLNMFLPDMYATTVGNINSIFTPHTGGELTVAEAMPLTIDQAMGNFGMVNYWFSYLALAVLAYYIIRKSSPEYTLMWVWSAFVVEITLAQNRFAYYYAVNVAILSAFICAVLLNWVGWRKLTRITDANIVHIAALVIVIALVGFLPAGAAPYELTMKAAPSGAISPGYYEWYFAMQWMKENTPDTGVDYYSTYDRPSNHSSPYPYPKTAYGVMSWWDYGHDITYWGHRIPVANPFQAGIGGMKGHAPGASTFLTAQTEVEGNKIMDFYGAKYVVTDAYMAYGIQGVFATWNNDPTISDPVLSGLTANPDPKDYYLTGIQTSKGLMSVPGFKSYSSMAGRLHILDASGLSHYRLVHEITPNPNNLGYKGVNPNAELMYKDAFNILYGGKLNVINSGYVKEFEYVKGANITGKAAPGEAVTLGTIIRTNINRTFPYVQRVTAAQDGSYSFTVPYSTIKNDTIVGTKFDVKPDSAYEVYVGNSIVLVDVSDTDVLEGRTVEVINSGITARPVNLTTGSTKKSVNEPTTVSVPELPVQQTKISSLPGIHMRDTNSTT